MKTIKLTTAVLAGLLLTGLTQCKKYEDNPTISLIPRENRITNFWGIQAVYENGENTTDNYNKYDLLIQSDGTAELNAEYDLFVGASAIETRGTWTFKNGGENIEFNFEDDSQDGEYEITKLTTQEFRFRTLDGNKEIYLKDKQ